MIGTKLRHCLRKNTFKKYLTNIIRYMSISYIFTLQVKTLLEDIFTATENKQIQKWIYFKKYLLTLNSVIRFSRVSIVIFEQVIGK